MIKFHRDAQGEGGEFINKTSRYSFITHCEITKHKVVGSIERYRDGYCLRDGSSNFIKKFCNPEEAIDFGFEKFVNKVEA